MIKTVECHPYLPEQPGAFGSVLTKLGKPVIPASGKTAHLSCKRISPGKGSVAVAEIRASGGQLTAEPGERGDQVIKYLARKVQICTHLGSLLRLSDRVITQDN